jgi:electron transfer flavoprotein beta subunit
VPYDSVVCVKQVPDTANVTAESMKEDGTVNRAALPTIFNPEDLYALETALEIKDLHGGTVNRGALPTIFNPEDFHALETALQLRDEYGGTVTVLSMGPPKAADVLRDSLFRGADRAILLTDRRAAASDTLATSYILAQAVRTIGRFDFVFCGRQAIDGDTAQVGPQCAEKLGIPQITYLEKLVSVHDRVARIRRNIGHGWEIVESKLPVLVTVLESANETRPAAAKRVMRSKRAKVPAEVAGEVKAAMPDASEEQLAAETRRRIESLKACGLLIEQWDLDDIHADLMRCGLAGSPTKVHRVQSIVLTKEGHTEIPATEAGIRQLIHELIVDRTWG